MSDDNLEREQPKDQETKEPSAKKKLFRNLNSDLRSALSTWENLTEEMAQKISPEETQLLEVKRLLGELKSKLKDFEE